MTHFGLLDTANVYGVVLIALALLALALSHRLAGPESPSPTTIAARACVREAAAAAAAPSARLRGRADPIGLRAGHR